MTPQQVALAQAAGRIAFGGAMIVSPAIVRGWLGAAAGSSSSTQVAIRALGVRDFSLGVGALLALRGGSGSRPWLALGGLCDLVDGVATLAARESLPRTGAAGVTALAFVSAATAAYAYSATD